MAIGPKTQRSKARQRSRRGQDDYKFTKVPALVKKGKRKVLRHLVTPENPKRGKDGVQFLPQKQKVAA